MAIGRAPGHLSRSAICAICKQIIKVGDPAVKTAIGTVHMGCVGPTD